MYEIDLYIRIQPGFDSRHPLRYKCLISSIQDNSNVQKSLTEYREIFVCYMTVENFIFRGEDRFTVKNGILVGVACLTPFQGLPDCRVFGSFKCFKCGKDWQSASTWTDIWQKCKRCKSSCYSYEQMALKLGIHDPDEEPKRHLSQHCQKCLLGRLCFP
jgi:hypothetical protein